MSRSLSFRSATGISAFVLAITALQLISPVQGDDCQDYCDAQRDKFNGGGTGSYRLDCNDFDTESDRNYCRFRCGSCCDNCPSKGSTFEDAAGGAIITIIIVVVVVLLICCCVGIGACVYCSSRSRVYGGGPMIGSTYANAYSASPMVPGGGYYGSPMGMGYGYY